MASDRALTIPLDPPIEHAGGLIGELKLREPTGAEMREAEREFANGQTVAASSKFEARLISAVSGLEERALNLLPVSVMRRAREFVVGFDYLTKSVEDPAADEFEVELPEPVTTNGVTYDRVTLHEPTVGMRRKAETAYQGGVNPHSARHYAMILIAEASEVPFAVVEKLPVSVINQADAYLMGFIRPGPEIGNA